MLFKALREATRAMSGKGQPPAMEYPLEVEQALTRAHGRAPVQRHLEMLYGGVLVGNEPFDRLFRRCMEATGTAVTPFNVFQRFQTRLDLMRYFLATLDVPGARAECGVYRGASALLLCHARRSVEPAYRGGDLYLVDSYRGTSASVDEDLIAVRDEAGSTRREAFFPVGKSDTSPELVRGFFAEYPDVHVCPGWIPDVFATLPDTRWAFVHLDLTLYEPTLAALEYFHPRLSPGGVLVCDGSVFCPGAARAWETYCSRRDLPYAALGHRETVILG